MTQPTPLSFQHSNNLIILNQKFYTCDVEYLHNLSDMWVEDPRFAVDYERIREGGAVFVREAVHAYCDHLLTTDSHR